MHSLLALSTSCCPRKIPLDQALASFRDYGLAAVALHRPARPEEAKALIPYLRKTRIVAVFDGPGADVGCPLIVVEGGRAGPDRDESLDELCRRLHALRAYRVAVRTPLDGDHHPSPIELPLLREALPQIGYWHDADRGGEEFLHAADAMIFGASFHPLLDADLLAIRATLPAGGPAVVALPAGSPREEILDALDRARGVFRA